MSDNVNEAFRKRSNFGLVWSMGKQKRIEATSLHFTQLIVAWDWRPANQFGDGHSIWTVQW